MVGDFLRMGWDSADSWISKRRSSQSVRELIRVVRKGNDVGITPDGSRGPIYEAKPGAILLVELLNHPSVFFLLNTQGTGLSNPGTVSLFHFHFQGSKYIHTFFLQRYSLRKDVMIKPKKSLKAV